MAHTMHLLLIVLIASLYIELCISQVPGEYPSPISVATYRPVTTTSVCGANGPETYCRYTTDAAASLAPNCISTTCNNTCPFSSSSPPPIAIATLGTLGPGVIATLGRPGSARGALQFTNSFVNTSAVLIPVLGGSGFSFASWIKQDEGNTGTLVSKATPDGLERNYVLTVNQSGATFDYLPSTLDTSSLPPGAQRYRSVVISGLTLDPAYWHHIALTVFAEDFAFYVNGTVVAVRALEGRMVDVRRSVFLGQTIDSVSYYNGLMQEIYFYTRALTAREVTELVTGSLPFTHLSPECHCPPSHPIIDPNPSSGGECIQHAGGDLVSRGSAQRINPLAHPPGFINDFGTLNGWISSPGDREVNITLHLTNSLYELIFVNFRYGSPRPKAAVLETSTDGGMTFRPIQYYADDCLLYFGLPNNGRIVNADDANCITTTSTQSPTFNADVRTRLLDPQTRNFNLNSSPELRSFLLASHLQLRLLNYFNESTTPLHLYYSILEVTVAARCACNGHSSRCGPSIDSVCQCVHNTQGDNCERCAPLYNDKPWRYGTTSNGFPCKLCDCNSHATSCHYNASTDPFPDSYDIGGGGVCENCQDNTAGDHCETCHFGFYRPPGRQPSDPSPCETCSCDSRGVMDGGDCVKNEGIGGRIPGQCYCKLNVIGRTCDTCREGFFGLSSDNPNGCEPCGCNTAGTFDASFTCGSQTGRCLCKGNVMGLKCDQCRNGTTSLNALNPLGCSPCACNLTGSLSNNCNPINGSCPCKPGVGGALCDRCLPGYFGFSDMGCQPCACHSTGGVSNVCHPVTGECTCRENVAGQNCDSCESGFYNVSASCLPCGCNTAGTIGGNNTCDVISGECDCKPNVQGRTCNSCFDGFTNLTSTNLDGCSPCNCFTPNTDTSRIVCDPMTSQCECVPSAMGLRCDVCREGFYFTPGGCVACDCDLQGSESSVCDTMTGQCTCTSDGVGGRACDGCLPGFFQFPNCTSCGCDAAGTMATTQCNPQNGTCRCKQYVTGTTCDTCIPGFQRLEASNPFGCSSAPDEQAPPITTPQSSTSILLQWLPPEASNGVILGYNVYRNASFIANTTSLNYTDTGLSPDSPYSYFIEAFNVIGSTSSVAVFTRTLEGIPSGLTPPTLRALNSSAVQASWQAPSVTNGVISRYELVLTGIEAQPRDDIVFSGFAFSDVVNGLRPFTVYSFAVRACTSGGCGQSGVVQVQTGQAPPTFQPAPNVTTLGPTTVEVGWVPPPEPNGILGQYEIFQREPPFVGSGFLVGSAPNSSLSLVVGGLRPFSQYEFRVVSSTMGGRTQSEWSLGVTSSSVPEGVLPPTLIPLGPSEIQVNWTEPLTPNGIIIRYGVYMVSVGRPSSRSLLQFSSEPGSLVVQELLPFTQYGFQLEACTSVGCNDSDITTQFTLESAPTGQGPPRVVNTTATSVNLEWDPPTQPNGIITNYATQRRRPSLSPSPTNIDIGIALNGNGFATFAPGSANLGGFINEISLRFRTFNANGTIIYYINAARTDYLAVELRLGVPWFFFDAGSGPAAIRPITDAVFSDGRWHNITIRQEGQTGTITIDGVYTGTGNSIGRDGVITANQTLYIGAIPPGFPRSTVSGSLNPNATLDGVDFVGCLFDITLNNGQRLDFSTQTNPGVSVGCPVGVERGTSLLGAGYLVFRENTITDSNFVINFDLRTTHTRGFVFFAHTGYNTSLAVELRSSFLSLVTSTAAGPRTQVSVGNTPFCDGHWHSISIQQQNGNVSLSVDGACQFLTLPQPNTTFFSKLYFGGASQNSIGYAIASDLGLDVDTPFSGCIRFTAPSFFVSGTPVVPTTDEVRSVRFDGCRNSSGPSCVSPWVTRDVGQVTAATDEGLNPFTDYLYRVSAHNSAGSDTSSWVVTMTQESAPSGVGAPELLLCNSSSLTLTWQQPTTHNGLITRYDITATPVSTTGLGSPLGSVAMETVEVQEPEMVLMATLTGLEPATTYSIFVTAYTTAGGGTGPATAIATLESVPIGVQAPNVTTVGSRQLGLVWNTPTQPNGIIIRYNLFTNNQLWLSTPNTSATVTNLGPFTEYFFFLQACTAVGCSNSSESTGQTLPDRPMGLAAPNLTALSPSSIQATWQLPANPNGVILRFELQRLFGPGRNQSEVIFSGLNFETTISGLTPNTLYSFQLLAFNAGGSVTSPVAEERTLEDIPDGITAPDIEIVNSTALRATWQDPLEPNGDIIQYNLVQNGIVVFSGVGMAYLATNLEPFTFYSYSIMACTVRGCGSSNQSNVRTLEDVPEGYSEPTIAMVTAESITLMIHPVSSPNGVVRYILNVLGEFSVATAGVNDTAMETRVVYNNSEPGMVVICNLLPFSSYEFTLSVVNSAGELTGGPFIVQTAEAAPMGLSAPMVTLHNDATTLRIQWTPPTQPNGPLLRYELTLTSFPDTLVFSVGLNVTFIVRDLRPFTYYEVFITVFNTVGSVASPSSNITTGETAPSGFDQAVILARGPRHLFLSWDPPAAANGILTNYTVLQDGVTLATLSPSVLEYNVSSLLPFTQYSFSVAVCNSAGCVESSSVTAMTLEDVPEGVPAPLVTNGIATTVLVSWAMPTLPNGIILEYQVERSVSGDDNFTTISILGGNVSRVVVDTSTQPFTTYEYRIVAANGAGSTTGPSTSFTTPEAAPSDVPPLILTALTASSIEVRFRPPLTPNGIIISYTLTRFTPPTPTIIPLNTTTLPISDDYFIFTDINLLPFTNYTYTLTVCTNGGCTNSTTAYNTTLEDTPQGVSTPTAIVTNSSTISLLWVSPTQPNGVIQGYDILRRDLGFVGSIGNTNVSNCCEEYIALLSLAGNGSVVLSESCSYVAETSPEILSYIDTTLQAYSFYQYCIITFNNADSAHSELSTPTQTNPAPMPAVGPQLNASTINSTAIYLTWGSLEISELLGPLEGYTLYGRPAGGVGLGQVLFTGPEQSYTATDLIASTEYIFMVAVSNGRGSTLGNNATATTEEGIPANLSAPVVAALSSSSISISWSAPQEPNGVIIIYTIFLDSAVHHNQSGPGTLVVGGLTSFTIYTIQVEACTQFGCTRSPLVAERTRESAPVGLASPVVFVTGPTAANVSWSDPIQPNGIITNYQLFVRNPEGNTLLVFSSFGFQFSATSLRPFTTYSFEVVAFNGAGNVSSGFTTVRTEEAAPSFVDPPLLTIISANEILLTWSQPEELNGALLGYQIYLGDTFLVSTLRTSYRHTSLEPFTEYTYTLEVCTNGGCTNSTTVSNTTFEALPEGVSGLMVSQLQARSLSLTWEPPARTNGIITEYILTLTNNNTIVFRGVALSLSVSGLSPFTVFTFLLQTCNTVGCVSSNITEVRTPETSPEGLPAPRLRNLTSTSVAIEWTAPLLANGNITSYILRRSNESSVEMVVVFQGLAFSYNDLGLVADTLYSYTIEAVNNGGSVVSSQNSIRTVPDLPDGIRPPNLVVLGATSIRVTWSRPERPNGVVSRYVLYMNNIPAFTGIGFEHTATTLIPFTLYSFYFEVCNQAGCASSITVSTLTDQSIPQGITPPMLNVLSATAIQVSWQPPTMPNGIIATYEIRRRLLNNPLTESIQHRNGPSVLGFPNSGLSPFTAYEYRLRVFNGAGNAFSGWVSARTFEDTPSGVSLPTFEDSDIFARNVTANWDPPTSPNGIITFYRFEYRLPLDPRTNLPGTPVTAEVVPGNVTTATAVGLQPVTIYEFRVVAINGAGEGRGSFETVTTAEDIPESLQEIVVEGRTGVSLTLTWSAPLVPNGIIREYLLYLDGELVYRDVARMYTVLRLQPFTSYTLQLVACNSAGCTFGNIQSVTTAETAPFGQPPPTLTAVSPRQVQVVWNVPTQPNGIITRYDILRQDNDLPLTLVVIASVNDTLVRSYNDTTVRPASHYQYTIRAVNSAGQTESVLRPVTTPEAPPEGLSAPVLTVTSSSSIFVTWNRPIQTNGNISEYQVLRTGGGESNISVYRGQNRIFRDTVLQPFTMYTYAIQACTSGGCSLSPNASATTLEDNPANFAAPTLEALSATEVSLQWVPPLMPNGIITHYLVTILPVSIQIRATQLAVNVTNLLPFTLYTINIDACNSIGCVTSSGQVRTLESTPQFVNAPELSAVDPFTVRVSWQPPARPNGVITQYDLRQNGTLVGTFNGSVLSIDDANLLPSRFYSYTIQAFTSVGGGAVSIASVIQTPPDTPENISAPAVETLSAYSVRARWSVPGIPNGIIRSYMLEVDGNVVFTGLAFEHVVDGLNPFTVYSFTLIVCTSTCGRSQVVTATTDEAPPMGQAPPRLVPNTDTTVSVSWSEPAVLNGLIRYYEVERRGVSEGGTRGNFTVVYNNSATQFLDRDPQLQPTRTYEYRVTAVNGGGRNTSGISIVTLLEAPPVGVYPPVIQNVTSVSLGALLNPPMVPNGVLTEYRLYQDGDRIHSAVPESQTASVSFPVSMLQPFTVYRFHSEVCTAGGCNTSEVVSARTAEAQPTGLGTPPVAIATSSRTVNISWVPPSQPNGEIVRYTLWFRLSCPQPEQPNQPTCTPPGPRTLATNSIPGTTMFYLFTGSGSNHPIPYSSYQFQIEATNSVGSVTSPYSTSVTTDPSAPEPNQTGLRFTTDQINRVIFLDWSGAFNLNSRLVHYIVTRNGISIQQLQGTQVTLTQEPVGTRLEYVVTVVTETGRASLDTVVLQLGATDTQPTTMPSESPTDTSITTVPTETPPFYREAAFIIGMVILGVVLVFTACAIFLCCVRPRGNAGYKVTESYRLDTMPLTTPTRTTPTRTTPTRSGLKHAKPQQEHATVTWTPGDPTWEIPDLEEEEETGPVMVPTTRSYSPGKAETAALLDYEVTEPTLPDTQIKGYTNPQQFLPAHEDFGSFRASQTTFADTKV